VKAGGQVVPRGTLSNELSPAAVASLGVARFYKTDLIPNPFTTTSERLNHGVFCGGRKVRQLMMGDKERITDHNVSSRKLCSSLAAIRNEKIPTPENHKTMMSDITQKQK
jgi:hypothetical protein